MAGRKRALTAADGPRALAAARIGEWPHKTARGAGRLAEAHAAGVWSDARSGVGWRSQRLWDSVGAGSGQRMRFEGQVDFAFLATVAGHLGSCGLCWQTWFGGSVPAELMTRAIRARPKLWQLFGPVVREIGVRRTAGTQYVVADASDAMTTTDGDGR